MRSQITQLFLRGKNMLQLTGQMSRVTEILAQSAYLILGDTVIDHRPQGWMALVGVKALDSLLLSPGHGLSTQITKPKRAWYSTQLTCCQPSESSTALVLDLGGGTSVSSRLFQDQIMLEHAGCDGAGEGLTWRGIRRPFRMLDPDEL